MPSQVVSKLSSFSKKTQGDMMESHSLIIPIKDVKAKVFKGFVFYE